jgi:uncharacterized C2H2 Zn-finger protein
MVKFSCVICGMVFKRLDWLLAHVGQCSAWLRRAN